MTGCLKLSDIQLKNALGGLPGWRLDDGCLCRDFEFGDFDEAWGFMQQVAVLAEQRNHHPDWRNVYNKVSIRLTTHEAGGITVRDTEMAEAIGAL